jgi:MFS family permease
VGERRTGAGPGAGREEAPVSERPAEGVLEQPPAPARSRAVPVLAAAQVLGGIGVASGIAVNGLLAEQLTGSASLAGLAQTMGVVGAAAMAVPLARLAAARGRRPALTTGYLLGTVGATVSIGAALLDTFWVLLVGAALFGGGTASGLQTRYAAIDGVPATHRARSLSLVVWATTVGSVTGPNLSSAGASIGRRVGVPDLAGPYLFSVAAFGLAALLVAVLLRPDPLAFVLAAGRAPADAAGLPAERVGLRGAVAAAGAAPAARLGLVTVGTAHAVMVAVMVMTPVHLHGDGAGLKIIGFVISAHIAGMYALSPVFGALSDRLGRRPVVGTGIGLLALAMLLAGTAGPGAHLRLGIGLVLLGLGWSACVVAGSTLLSESIEPPARTAVQGLSDLVMGVAAAGAGVLAGPALSGGGYGMLNALTTILLVPVLLLVLVPGRPAATG